MQTNRVILIACSDTKRPLRGENPAYMLYNGPLWQTMTKQAVLNDRRAKPDRREFPFSIVLSAKYGFIFDGAAIETYDQRLTPARADEIIDQEIGFATLRRHLHEPAEVYLAGGKLYRATCKRAIERLNRPRITIIEPSPARGIGDIRAGLIAYIDASPLIRPRLF